MAGSQLIYAMGSNLQGQLGIDDPYTQSKSSPVLVEALVAHKPIQVACGNSHVLALMSKLPLATQKGTERSSAGATTRTASAARGETRSRLWSTGLRRPCASTTIKGRS